MDVIRIDHIHIKAEPDSFSKTVTAIERIIGKPFLLPEMDFEDEGMKVGYNTFPNGFEIMSINDSSKELAALYEKWEGGVFALSLKIEDIRAAQADMEKLGYKAIVFHDFGPVHEILFDTLADLPFYIELVQSPDDLTAEDAGF
jgi:hypothetical protein